MTDNLQFGDQRAKREAFRALRSSLAEADVRSQGAPADAGAAGARTRTPAPGEPGCHSSAGADLAAEAAHRVYQAAYERAVRYLAAREHSERELLNKLRARDVEGELACRVLDDLKSRNLQSDARFAEEFVRSRVGRGHGPIRIRQELARRGIADDLLEEVLTRSGEFWVGIAAQAREKRFGEWLPEERGDWNRQARFLAARGFPADLIYRVLGNLS